MAMLRETPLIRSKNEIRAASAALERMRSEKTYEAFAGDWQTFVDRLEKAWVKAERKCQSFRIQFEPWQATYKVQRAIDPLLQYLNQSRHADQHSVQVLTGFPMARLILELPPLSSAHLQVDDENGTVKITAGGKDIKYSIEPVPERFYLFPITNWGQTYNPPQTHLGTPLDGTNPLFVAEKGLAYYQGFLQKAETKFFPASS